MKRVRPATDWMVLTLYRRAFYTIIFLTLFKPWVQFVVFFATMLFYIWYDDCNPPRDTKRELDYQI